jgi:CBS-domain-containing membrane protein
MNVKNFIQSFKPHASPTTLVEIIRSALMSGAAILLLGYAFKYMPFEYSPLMLGSMAAAATLLFALPHSPMSQPWPLVGGNLVSALAGWACFQLIHDPILAAGCAVGLAIFLMHTLRCLHPPGAATALILILSSAQFHATNWHLVAYIVAANIVIMLLLALVLNNLVPGRHYPARTYAHPTPDATPASMPVEIEQRDIAWAASHIDGFVDITEEDLASIYELASQHAQRRYQQAIDARKISRT